ncbi:MAG: hypothetical protein WB689_36570 [Xanthobacteraceae bacterium]
MTRRNGLEGRDAKSGRFLTGNNGGGRNQGSRNKLTTEFLNDLYSEWQKSGKSALARLAETDPGGFARLVLGVLPRELDIALTVNSDLFVECRDFLAAFRLSQKVIGGELEIEDLSLIGAVDATKDDA